MLQQQGKDREEEEEEEYCSPSFRMESPERISSALMMSSVSYCEGEEDSSDFSFEPVSDACPRIAMGAPADEIFSDGKIRPAYPLFNRDLLLFPCNIKADDVSIPIPIPIPIPTQQQQQQQNENGNENEKKKKTEEESEQITSRSARQSLRRLFMEEEREQSSFSSTSSSSETDSSSIFVDDLYGVPPETYCVWSPGSKAISKKKKSSSFRWRLKGIDLLMGRSQANTNKEEKIKLERKEQVVGEG